MGAGTLRLPCRPPETAPASRRPSAPGSWVPSVGPGRLGAPRRSLTPPRSSRSRSARRRWSAWTGWKPSGRSARVDRGHRGGHRHPPLLHRRQQGLQEREELHCRCSRRQIARARHFGLVRHRVRRPLEAQAHPRRLRPLPTGLRLHALRRTPRIPLHPRRRLVDARAAWRLNKYGTTNSKAIAREAATRPRGRQRKEAAQSTSKTSGSPAARKPPTASKRYTPKAPTRKKIPKAAARIGIHQRTRTSEGQSAASISNAERSSCSASVRRRTSERAVGSSPRARSTSTSVTIPMTVE